MVCYLFIFTTELVLTLGVAFTLLVGVLLIGFLTHQWKISAAFIPAGTPLALIPVMILLELLAYTTRTLSLGLRLAVNLITGHILAKVIVGFIWLGATSLNSITFLLLAAITLFLGLEILIAYLQAYIFTFITCITLKDLAML
jgi:F-type H+-transporting ATPase subunit a